VASRYVRKVRTASGAVAVQVVTKAHGEFTDIQHVGSAHTDAELALLLHAARELLHPGQGELDLGPVEEAAVSVDDVADWTRPDGEAGLFPAQEPGGGPGRPAAVAAGGRVVGTVSLLLWKVLEAAATTVCVRLWESVPITTMPRQLLTPKGPIPGHAEAGTPQSSTTAGSYQATPPRVLGARRGHTSRTSQRHVEAAKKRANPARRPSG
jgi:hypothetical protein